MWSCCTVILKLINFISFPNKTKYQTHWPNQFSLIYRYCYLSCILTLFFLSSLYAILHTVMVPYTLWFFLSPTKTNKEKFAHYISTMQLLEYLDQKTKSLKSHDTNRKKKKLTCLLSSSDFEKSWKPGCSFLFSFQAELVGINREHTYDAHWVGCQLHRK